MTCFYEHDVPLLRSINTGDSVIGSVSTVQLKCDGTTMTHGRGSEGETGECSG